MYHIDFTDTAKKHFSKLEPIMQERVTKALERIRIRPEAHITKLVGNDSYRLRVGDYRLILEIDLPGLIIYVTKIGHRKNIYNLKL